MKRAGTRNLFFVFLLSLKVFTADFTDCSIGNFNQGIDHGIGRSSSLHLKTVFFFSHIFFSKMSVLGKKELKPV